MDKKGLIGLAKGLMLSGFIVLNLGSCEQLFTTSLAPWAARDPASLIPTVTADNVTDLIDQSANNPEQSMALLDAIADAMTDASASEAAVLRAAALEAGSNSSGVATAIFSNAGTLLDTLETMESSEEIIPLISDAIADLSNLAGTATDLVSILPDPSNTTAFDAFVAQATPEDLAMAAIVLLAAEAQADTGGVETYITGFDPEDPSLSPSEALAVALAEAAADSYAASGGTGQLADILEGLHLTTNP